MRVHRVAAGVVVAALAAAAGGGDPPAGAPAWKLGPSDMAHYERRTVTVGLDGKETLGKPDFAGIHGHDLRDGGLYLPVTPARADLPAIFALRTPAADAQWRLALPDVTTVVVKGAVRAPDASGSLRYAYEFASAGKAGKDDKWALRDGTGRVRLAFDEESGAPKRSEVDLTYTLEPVEKSKDAKPRNVLETWRFDLLTVRRCRYSDFQTDVDAAIDAGVAHLRRLQKDDGTFEPPGNWIAGTTALAAYTLSSCGVPTEDPAVEKALAYVCAHEENRTYANAVALMALERAYAPPPGESARRPMPPERHAFCERIAATLEATAGSPGSWGYPPGPRAAVKCDSSNTQYGALGMLAASKLGLPVREATWLGLVRHFEQLRERDAPAGSVALLREGQSINQTVVPTPVAAAAGFLYCSRDSHAWGSMTCAAISSLAIARSELERAKSRKLDARTGAEIDEMIAGGFAWLDRHWGVDRHPEEPGGDWYHYFLYSLERAGILAGVKRVGGRDWYFEGACQLIARQQDDGSWDEGGGEHTTETCFALLFLKRATAPLTPR